MIQKTCAECGKTFEDKSKNHLKKYCSENCMKKASYKRSRKNIIAHVIKWQKENPERVNEKSRKYYRTHQKEHYERTKDWIRRHPKEREEIYKRYKKAHPERVRAFRRNWRLNNPEKVRDMKWRHFQKYHDRELEKKRKWREKHPEDVRRYKTTSKLNRRATIKAQDEHIKNTYLLRINKRDKVCVYCGSDKNLTYDHIISVNKGGKTKGNLVRACGKCNSSKHNKNVFLWCKQKGYKVPDIVI